MTAEMAATTATRSTRRLDGLHHPHLYNPLHHQPVSQQQQHQQQQQQQAHSVLQGVAPGQRTIKQQQQQRPNMAMKRHLPPLDRDIDTIKRKKHFVVEIPSKLASHRLQSHNSHHQTVASSQAMSRPPEPAPQPTTQLPPPPPVAKATAAAPTTATAATAPPPPPRPQQATVKNPTTTANKPQNLTKHKEKVANGLKHELDRLQPSEAATKVQGRKLRSQEATRFKSELSAYFPDYDEVIGNDPKEHHLLNIDTPIVITDSRLASPPTIPLTTAAAQNIPPPPPPHPQPLDSYPIRSYGDHLFTDLCDSQRIDFDFLKAQHKGTSAEDPLTDTVYEGPHKKAERLERSIRNLERGRAQHEKDQVIRLLDSLQGPDWLKVMGVSGITEGKKKSFEPARAHFIKGCQAILDKFRRWTAEEKRRKQEKDQRERAAKALRDSQEQESEEEEEEEEEEEQADADEEAASGAEDAEMEDDDGAADDSDGDPPDSIDVDASVAKQLREEALAASKTNARSRARARARDKQQSHKQRSVSAQPPPAVAPEPPKEFKSFFKKSYQRAAAFGKNRRRGRTVLAWGHPVPEPVEREFELPVDLLDEETLRAQARRKRKERRGKH